MKESTKIKQKQRDGLAKILSAKALNASFAVITFALLGLASPLIDLPGNLGAAKAVAQEGPEKKQKTEAFLVQPEKCSSHDYTITLRLYYIFSLALYFITASVHD